VRIEDDVAFLFLLLQFRDVRLHCCCRLRGAAYPPVYTIWLRCAGSRWGTGGCLVFVAQIISAIDTGAGVWLGAAELLWFRLAMSPFRQPRGAAADGDRSSFQLG
jgi:hypothetical protein